MRTSVCAALLLIALAVPVFAVPNITNIDPQEGFAYGQTHVTIEGTGFSGGLVTVLFGSEPGTVLTSNDTRILAIATRGSNPTDRAVAVTVRVFGHGESVFSNAFQFHPDANPNPEDYTAAIVPLTAGRLNGAHGSIWEAQLNVYNAFPFDLRMPGPEETIVELPIDFAIKIPARKAKRVELFRRETGVDGHFLYIPTPMLGAPKFSLRVRDISENATSLGAEVPVITRNDAFNNIIIPDVPVDPNYRPTLRIYGFTPAPMFVTVTVYPENGDTPYSETDVELHGILTTQYVPFPPHPAYAAFDPIPPAARAAGGRVRVEITNHGDVVSPPLPPIWAFVSLTNNETNQVTIVTPK